jgi:hypothetical protein
MNPRDAEEYTQALGQIVAGSWRQVAWGKRMGVPEALGITTEEWVHERLGGYVRLSIPERREAVAELTEEGMSTREIGDVLGVNHDTVASDRRAVGNPTEPESQPAAEHEQEPEPVGNPTTPEPEPERPPAPVDVRDTDLGRLASEDLDVRQVQAAREFASAVKATTWLGPQIEHVTRSVLAVEGEHSAERARNCLAIWAQVVEALDGSRTLRRVK